MSKSALTKRSSSLPLVARLAKVSDLCSRLIADVMRRRERSKSTMFRAVSLIAFCILCLTGCAAGSNPLTSVPGADGAVAGFWVGLWHGIILPFMFVASLFSDSVSIYEVHNNGGWYNFGYLIGAAAVFERSGRVVVVHRNQNAGVTSPDA